jgi:uncharacterized protein (TIGR03435 family)
MARIILTLAAALTIGALTASHAQQVQQQVVIGGGGATVAGPAAPLGPMSFEVASVKQNVSGGNNIRFGLQPGGRFNAVNAPARELLRFAYMVQNFQIVDAPDWVEDDRYDIVAKAETDIPPSPPGQLGPMQMMMRSLLADRFRLIAREETREMPMYALVLDRPDGQLGPQLKESTTDCQALMAAARRGGGPPAGLGGPGERPQCGMRFGFGELRAGSARIDELARLLSGQLERFVVDRTGLTASYDFDLTFTPDRMPQGGAPPAGVQLPAVDPNGPSIFTALQEQLGLKLEATRGPVPVLVVERIERPTPD